MLIRKLAAFLAASSLVAAPALAQQSASALSLSNASKLRAATAAPVTANRLDSDEIPPAFLIGGGIIVVLIILELTGVIDVIGGDPDSP